MNKTKLITFIYLLVRDYVPTGQIGNILVQLEAFKEDETVDFTNKFMEEYAKDVVERLTK